MSDPDLLERFKNAADAYLRAIDESPDPKAAAREGLQKSGILDENGNLHPNYGGGQKDDTKSAVFGRASRRSDYNPDMQLIVNVTEDMDAGVMILGPGVSLDITFAGVGGGGRSPRTRAALFTLLEAMREDALEEE